MTDTLRCPQCGGENPLPSGVRLLRCRFCDAALFVDRSGLVSHYRLPRLVDRRGAEEALRRWMAGNHTVKDLDKKASGIELAPLAFPLWMFRQRTAGGEVVHVEPAAATPESAMADLEVPAGKLEPFRAGAVEAEEAEVAAATPALESGAVPDAVERVEATVPLETARGWLGQQLGAGRGAGGSGEITETALVHVPFWRAGYLYGGRRWSALVEGSTGVVLASVYPEKSEAPYWLVAGLGLLAFGLEGVLIYDLFLKAAAYAVTAVPLLGLAWWVTKRV
jgi:hypothetical protein